MPDVFNENQGYHTHCYKNFSAIATTEKDTGEEEPQITKMMRSSTLKLESSSTGCLEPICIFCKKDRKKVKGKWENLGSNESINAEINVRNTAIALNDQPLLLQIGNYQHGEGPDFVAKEVKYHHSCRKNYINSTRTNKKNEDNHMSIIKVKAINYIKEYIQTNIIGKNSSEFVENLLIRYKTYYNSLGGNPDDFKNYKVQYFVTMLKKNIPENNLTIQSDNTKKLIAFKTGMTLTEANKIAKCNVDDKQKIIWQCALLLRERILNNPIKPLEEPLSVSSILEGEVGIPQDLTDFFQIMYTGSDSSNELTCKKERVINSTAADVVYACSNGKQLPGKHLSLGLTTKAMTGSRRTVTLLNRLGHCASNETVRRIEMGMESTIVANHSLVPSHIETREDLCTALAWDNFDINIETPSGADTIHHTYGICYQNIVESMDILPTESTSAVDLGEKRKIKEFRRVNENSINEDIEPYWKKPKQTNFDFFHYTVTPNTSYVIAKQLDMIWMMIVNLTDTKIPMWLGWNSLSKTVPIKQRVCYMKHIQLPPTRTDVVKETMKRSQAVSKDCGQQFTVVTYDLAIAKVAKQLQSTEAPEFDDMFIMFGAFHIMQNVFSCLGKMIEGSGGPYALAESNIVAPGSLNSFLKGKTYKRCKQGHLKLATVFHGLHLARFMEDVNVSDEVINDLNNIEIPIKTDSLTENIQSFLSKYDVYVQSTIDGERGKTAQFWMQYTHIVDLSNILHRAIKTNDPELFGCALFEMSSIFFPTNHSNYARWMVLYSLELVNLNPHIKEMLKSGCFSVNRTGKSFANVAVDMALEQTINAEAKNRLKGIMKYADVATAVNRWSITSSMKTELVNNMLELCGISKTTQGKLQH